MHYLANGTTRIPRECQITDLEQNMTKQIQQYEEEHYRWVDDKYDKIEINKRETEDMTTFKLGRTHSPLSLWLEVNKTCKMKLCRFKPRSYGQ